MMKMKLNDVIFPVTRIKIIALVFLFIYVLGALLPDLFWTTHFLSFFPALVSLVVILFSVFILFKPSVNLIKIDLSSNITVGFITLIAGVIMYCFPILHDQYGDSYKFTLFLNKVALVIPEMAKEKLFKFSIGTSDGQDSILSIVTYISHYFNITYGRVFLWLGVFCGSLFVLSWQLFIRFVLKNKSSQLIMLLAGCTAPFMLNYFGHIEIYAPILLFNFIWMMLLVVYYQLRSIKIIWLLIFLWIICLKLHSIAVLYFPVLILTLLFHFIEDNLKFRKLLRIKGLGIFIVLPIFLIGTIVYFFILEDHIDPRSLSVTVHGMDRLFLPLFSPDPPLDSYNLFSLNHIFDFLILPFLWSPISIYLIIVLFGKQRKSINWNHIPILLVGLIFLLSCMLFFVANPLLSMPFDWDLFCLPGVSFLILTVLLIEELEQSNFSIPSLIPGVLSITIISLPFFIVHSSTPMLSKRYEALGMRVYDSYYEWTFKKINYALEINNESLEQLFMEREKVIEKLRPKAMNGVDPEFAQFLTEQGRYMLRGTKNLKQSIPYFEESDLYDPDEPSNTILHLEALFGLNQFEEALNKALILVDAEYPTKEKSIAIVVHCALKAKKYNIAKKYSSLYTQQWENEVMDEIHYSLMNNINIDMLHLLFDKEF